MPFMNNIKELCLVPGKASGDIASFEAAAAPLVSCICTLNPVQSGSGDPSPSNIRPITGHDDVTITQKDGNNTIVDTTTITFPNTVYGGTLDVGTGVLTIDRAIVTLDGTTNWISDTASNFRYFDSEMTALNTTAWETNVLSNLFAKQGTFPYCQINGGRKVRVIFNINDTSVTTVAQLQALLTQTNLQVVYPLATPTTTQLTPEQLNSILGDNNFYHDGNGPIDITYIRR